MATSAQALRDAGTLITSLGATLLVCDIGVRVATTGLSWTWIEWVLAGITVVGILIMIIGMRELGSASLMQSGGAHSTFYQANDLRVDNHYKGSGDSEKP